MGSRNTTKKIENRNQRHTTFFKRRSGLFQKAVELCTMCKAQSAVIVFSSIGKPYAFGHSSVDSIFNHYLNGTVPTDHGVIKNVHQKQVLQIDTLKYWLRAKAKEKKNERKQIVDLHEWIENQCVECQSVEEIESLKKLLMALKEKVVEKLIN